MATDYKIVVLPDTGGTCVPRVRVCVCVRTCVYSITKQPGV